MSRPAKKKIKKPTTIKTRSHPAPNKTAQKPTPVSKQARVISMLEAPAGTTIPGIVKAMGWKENSVRGFLAGTISKKLKLKLSSEKVDGKRIYRISGNQAAASAASSTQSK